MKRLCILGSTGSIGASTLDVIAANPDQFRVVGLTAGRNIALLADQVRACRPGAVAMSDPDGAAILAGMLGDAMPARCYTGVDGLTRLIAETDADLVVNGLVGAVGLLPTLRAVERGIDVALANKETMVVAGGLVTQAARKSGAHIIPVDSEHNALWQCLVGEDASAVQNLYLTASGGPFRTRPKSTFGAITKADALNHPNWDMGPKITIDSATMMNKGLEVIEAHWLFDIPAERIRIVIHPQSIIHSMVEFVDGSFKAQLGAPDMRLPIQYALAWPDRLPTRWDRFDPLTVGTLEFAPPDLEKFPAIRLAYEALETGGSMPAVLNAANEEAVARFLDDTIKFVDITRLIAEVMTEHTTIAEPDLSALLAADAWARAAVNNKLKVYA